jgi:hypothetical protein
LRVWTSLLFQVGQPFLHCLDLELEVGQVGFQFGGLLGFGQVAALEAAIPAE